MEELMNILPILAPILLLEMGMRIYAIIDILKLEEKGMKTKGNNPLLWIILVAVINFCWVLYFIIGKEE